MPAIPPTPRQLSEIGALLAEPARASMLLALADGTARPAGELARAAGVGAPTASAHLKRLLEGGLLAVQVQGRHRYYRLAGDEVAGWLEALALPRQSIAPPSGDTALRRARSCYRHLAGQLGVALCAELLGRGHLTTTSEGLSLAPAGAAALAEAGLNPEAVARLPGLRGRACLDWTERRLHVGGPLGVALTGAMLEAGWLRHASHGRALLPSVEGLRRFALLGVRLPG
ncbi:ArsR family transcriptional regulator [Frateuria edaphi]|uniref:ArsR/SmtB family transcription factor n=1 Tax=Frateuria edaphi TaxID=2898793 RepID=UPI001E3046D1|nr:helix-turn-helix transcriptional regulator [Frateuria edaphi]UGB45364.1 ArsR family transcriptional regulator [Frateuria edaphi]